MLMLNKIKSFGLVLSCKKTTNYELKKTILITGAGSGLRKGSALGLASKGHYVIPKSLTISERWNYLING